MQVDTTTFNGTSKGSARFPRPRLFYRAAPLSNVRLGKKGWRGLSTWGRAMVCFECVPRVLPAGARIYIRASVSCCVGMRHEWRWVAGKAADLTTEVRATGLHFPAGSLKQKDLCLFGMGVYYLQLIVWIYLARPGPSLEIHGLCVPGEKGGLVVCSRAALGTGQD